MRWINLEPVIQSEISQKDRDKYCILIHAYGIEKDDTDEPICRAAITLLLKTGTKTSQREKNEPLKNRR